MNSCCSICSSANQVTFDSAAVCMDCATVTTSFATFPVGLMVLAGTVVALGIMAFKKIRSMLPVKLAA
ncbi:MAG: hypothetical protein P8L37_02160 [Phycisphaerales bacterium]|nr:hypothetical protein [Phycisphaerales bacterium]